MKPITKKLAAALVAAATLFGGIAITNSAMAADGDVSDVPAAEYNQKQSLTVMAEKAAYLTGHKLYAVKVANYTNAQQTEHVQDSKTSYTITRYDVTTPDAPNGLKAAIAAAAKAGIKGNNETETAELKQKVDDNNPMAWVVANLLDSSTSPYAGKLRDFLTTLGQNTVLSGTLTATDGSVYELTQGSGDDAVKATASVAPGIYIILDKTATTTTSAENALPASITMMTGTKLNGKKFVDANGTVIANGEIEYKPVLPTIDKFVAGGNVHNDKDNASDPNNNKRNDVSIGDDVTYTLTSKVPNWTGYKSYFLAMNDNLSKGLDYVEYNASATGDEAKKNMAIYVQKVENGKLVYDKQSDGTTDDLTKPVFNTNPLVYGTDYKVKVTENKDNNQVKTSTDIRILFGDASFGDTNKNTKDSSDIIKTDNWKAKFPVNAAIKVVYHATLNANAVIGKGGANEDGNPNTVNLEYSNNPNGDSIGKTEDHKVITYTGAFALQKVDNTGTALPGVKYQVFKKKADGSFETAPMKFTCVTDTNSKCTGVYTPSDKDGAVTEVTSKDLPDSKTDAEAYKQALSGDAAKVTLNGLDGEYKVVETYSPLTQNSADKDDNGVVKNDGLLSFVAKVEVANVDKQKFAGEETVTENREAGDTKVSFATDSQDKNKLVTLQDSTFTTDKQADGTTAISYDGKTFRVQNVRSFLEMPKTGQTWLIIYGVVALMFVACGAVLLSTGKKSAAHKGQKA